MAEKAKCEEALLFKKYSAELKRAILHPVDLADKLCSSQIIDKLTLEKIKTSEDGQASILVNAVEVYIESQEKTGLKLLVRDFVKILEVFRNFIPLNCIVEAMEKEYYGK